MKLRMRKAPDIKTGALADFREGLAILSLSVSWPVILAAQVIALLWPVWVFAFFLYALTR